MLEINTKLSDVYQTAKEIHAASIINGVVDLSEVESLFCEMQTIAKSSHISSKVSSEYSRLYMMCMATRDVEEFSDIEDVEGLPDDYRELAQAAYASCPEIEAVDTIEQALHLIHRATGHMEKEDKDDFISDLSDLLSSYDLFGEDATKEIFSNSYCQ